MYVRTWPLVQIHCYVHTYYLCSRSWFISYSMYIRTCYAHCVYRKPTLAEQTLAMVSLVIIGMYMYPLNVSNFYCVILYTRTKYVMFLLKSPAAGWQCWGGKELFKAVTLVGQSKCYRSLRSCKERERRSWPRCACCCSKATTAMGKWAGGNSREGTQQVPSCLVWRLLWVHHSISTFQCSLEVVWYLINTTTWWHAWPILFYIFKCNVTPWVLCQSISTPDSMKCWISLSPASQLTLSRRGRPHTGGGATTVKVGQKVKGADKDGTGHRDLAG